VPFGPGSYVPHSVGHSLYSRYRRRKIARQISRYAPREVTHVYGGHSLNVRLADPLAEGWYDHDWEALPVLGFLRELGVMRPGARVFDIGAHQAVVALMIARDVGAEGHVLAVEAEPHNARVAAQNRELNRAWNLTVLNAAGGARPGVTSFAEGLNGHVDETTTAGNITVPTVTVDLLAAEHGWPDLVFIDVEGYEGQVLDGASDTLKSGSSTFVVEVHETLASFGGSPDEIVERFSDFDAYVAESEEQPFAPLDGAPPRGRFFLIAAPAARSQRPAGRGPGRAGSSPR
jgi:FkbM family methyltransferase